MFSDNIKKLREEAGLTQDEFAEKIFVTRTAVSKWENGKSYPSIDSLKVISELFGVSIDYLVKEDLEEPTSVQPTEKNNGNKKLFGIFKSAIRNIFRRCYARICFK